MEKLTKKYEDGLIGINCDAKACRIDGPCPETSECECVRNILNKLAEYEETDLTPEQFAEFDKMYLEKCEEVNRLRAELAERK